MQGEVVQALYMMKQETDGDRDDECPVGSHDIDLVQAEAQAKVQHQVERHTGEQHPQETATAAIPHTCCKQQQKEDLMDIAEPGAVRHDSRTGTQTVLQQIVTMQQEAFTQHILHRTLPTRRADIGPGAEARLADGLSLIGIPRVFHVPLVHLPQMTLIATLGLLIDRSRVVKRGRSVGYRLDIGTEFCGTLGTAFGSLLLFTRFYVFFLLPLGITPDGGCRQEDGEDEIARSPEAFAIGEECHDKRLHAIAHRDTRREQEEYNGLELGKRFLLLHLLACQVHGQCQQGHRRCEVVGHDIGQRDIGKRERQVSQQIGIHTSQSNHLAHGTADEDKRVERHQKQDDSHNDLSQVQSRQRIQGATVSGCCR